MGIRRNITLEEQINDAARRLIEATDDRREGLHFSDLLTPRQGYFKHLMPKPPTDGEVGFFVAGRAHHEVILSIMRRYTEIKPGTDEGSKLWEDVWYSPDFSLGFLAEVKTNRRNNEPETEYMMARDFETYINQLKQYMVAEETDTGVLVVFFINLKIDGADGNKATVPTFRCYQVTFDSDEERDALREKMVRTRDMLRDAMARKDHRSLPLCPAWMCCAGGYRGPAIPRCKWYDECQPEGRWPAAQYSKAAKEKKL